MPNNLIELNKLRTKRSIMIGLVLMFICMGLWILVSIGSTSRQSQIEPELKDMAKSLNPTLDLTVLDKIEKKYYMSSAELSSFPIYVIIQDPTTREEKIQIISPQLNKAIEKSDQ